MCFIVDEVLAIEDVAGSIVAEVNGSTEVVAWVTPAEEVNGWIGGEAGHLLTEGEVEDEALSLTRLASLCGTTRTAVGRKYPCTGRYTCTF